MKSLIDELYFLKWNTESEQQTGYCNFIIKCETSLRQDKLVTLQRKRQLVSKLRDKRGQI